jgi:DNA-binding transcriptional ArsR family regulator
MREFLAIAKALSDENRVRALMALSGGELCVCQIIELLGLAPSTVSKHMAILHQAGLVETRKDGRWIYYRLAEEPNLPCARQALTMTLDCLGRDGQIREDARTLKGVRKMTREELCRHYKAC